MIRRGSGQALFSGAQWQDQKKWSTEYAPLWRYSKAIGFNMVLGNQLWVVLLEQGVGPADLQKSLPTSMLLWLCDQQIFINILDPLKNRTFMGKFSPFPKTFNSSPWKIMLSNHISFPIYFSPYVSFSVWLIWNTSEIFIIWKYWFSLFFIA